MKKITRKTICLFLASVLTLLSFSPAHASAKSVFKVKSAIDGTTITCKANSSVSKTLKTEAYASWESSPSVFIPNISIWSGGAAVPADLNQTYDGLFNQNCRFYGNEEEMKSLVNDYLNLLEKYGFSVIPNDNTSVPGYEYLITKKLAYTGNENVSKNMCEDYFSGTYDAEIMYFKQSYSDYALISIKMPKEIGVKDTGERRGGSSVSSGEGVSLNTVKSDQSFFIPWGEYDTYTIYAFGNSEDYIEIKLKTGAYRTGSAYNYDDFKNLRDVNYTIMSHEIVEDDIYNYIEPAKNEQMIKDFKVKVLKADKNVKALYYYIVISDLHASNYVLEGISVSDKRVKSKVKMNFKSNGKVRNLKNNSSITAVNGTTYKIKEGSSVTFKSPTANTGFSHYVYSFYANKSGIVETKHPYITSPTTTIKAVKKGTIFYKVGFTGSKKVTKVSKIKVPGTSSSYTTNTYQVYENEIKEQIIKIIVTK